MAERGGWPALLGLLCRGEDLDAALASGALASVLAGEATEAQIAAFCVGLRMKGETVDEVSALLDAMLERAVRVALPAGVDAVDTCGTGGDRSGSINASTIAALVVAGAGVAVCKHGNRAASSACGSADVLEALGVALDVGPEGVAACVQEAGIGFCFAPRFHPTLRHVAAVRRQLGLPTVFNLLGPLANPAAVRRQALGVSDPGRGELVMGVLRARGAKRALVFWGDDGLDELSTTGPSTLLELRDGEVHRSRVDPEALGLRTMRLEDLRGGDAPSNADAARRVLGGDRGPHRDFVLLNAAAGLLAAGAVDDLASGMELAATSVDSGRAAAALDGLVKVSAAYAGPPPAG